MTVVDFGGAIGNWGVVPNYTCIDYGVPREMLLTENYIDHDLRTLLNLENKYDLAISMEVGEHLDEKYADIFVENISKSSDYVLFSAEIGRASCRERVCQYV